MEMIVLVTMNLVFGYAELLPKGQNVFPDTASLHSPTLVEVTVHSSINECRNKIKSKLFDIISDPSAKLLPTSDEGYGEWYQIKEPIINWGLGKWHPEEALINFDVRESYDYPNLFAYGAMDGRLVDVYSLECQEIKAE